MGTIHVNFAFRDADARSKVLVGRGRPLANSFMVFGRDQLLLVKQ